MGLRVREFVDSGATTASKIAGWNPLTRLSRDCGIATLSPKGGEG